MSTSTAVKRSRMEIFKFAFYVFGPIGILAYVESPYYQEKNVKPYTLFPSSGKKVEMDHVPLPGESREQWKERLAQTAPVRRRAKEIYVELKTKDDAASSVSVPEPRMATTTTTASSSGH